jgi:hypothetical protein
LEKIRQVAYKLKLPLASKIHNVFHVSQIKEYRADYTPVFAELPKTPELDVIDTIPEKILDRRLVKKGNTTVTYTTRGCSVMGELGNAEDSISSGTDLGTSQLFWGGTCHGQRRDLDRTCASR